MDIVEQIFQLHFDDSEQLLNWLRERGWELHTANQYKVFHTTELIEHHLKNNLPPIDPAIISTCRLLLRNDYYLVAGKSSREANHICIFKDGELVWGPHPSDEGLLTLENFYRLEL